MPEPTSNLNANTVAGFGDEWTRFDQSALAASEAATIFDAYFSIFPWDSLPAGAVGFDLGCGSGRWARLVAPRVGTLHCVDASPDALAVARRNLAAQANVVFENASVGDLPFDDDSLDFGYSLGVLHHVPDTRAAIAAAVRKLKRGAPLLLYLYYAFDNRPAWFRAVWKASDQLRAGISRAPRSLRYMLSQVLAFTVYLPLARGARAGSAMGMNVDNWPLSSYRDRSVYVMRTDALDRFGTQLEQRFTRRQIDDMMRSAGLRDITFRTDGPPYWVAVGRKG